MPYERLSGQVVKAEVETSTRTRFDVEHDKIVMDDVQTAHLVVSLPYGNIISLFVPVEDSGAWMGKEVSVVITTKDGQ